MGERITFRERTEGVCAPVSTTDPSKGASIMEPRVKYVRGWISTDNDPVNGTDDPEDGSVECGDDTTFCMLVTRAQLEEIAYRVKDSWFTSGSATDGFGDPIYFNGIDPLPQQVVSALGDGASWQRGYVLAPDLSGESIPAGDTWRFEDPYEVAGKDVYEAKKETAMWYGLNWPAAMSPIGLYWDNVAEGFASGMNHYSFSEEPDDGITPPTYYGFQFQGGSGDSLIRYGCNVYAHFSGRVAYIDADNPIDDTAKLYIEVIMEIKGVPGFGDVRAASTYRGEGMVDSGSYFRIGLSNSDTTAKAKLYTDLNYTFEDFVLTAKKWWPYAHPNGSPVWDEDTGAYIPEVPPP